MRRIIMRRVIRIRSGAGRTRIAVAAAGLALLAALAACEPFEPTPYSGDGGSMPWLDDPLPDAAQPEPEPDIRPDVPPIPPDEGTERPDDPVRLPAVAPTVFADAVLGGDGRHLLFQRADGGRTCLEVADLETGAVQRFADRCDLRWITADPAGGRAWLLESSGDRVAVLRLADGAVPSTLSTEDTYTVMEASPTGATLVLSNVPTDEWSESQYEWNTYDMDMRHLAVVRPESGALHEQTFPFAIRDVAFSPKDGAVLVALSWWKEDGQPEAQVHFMNPESGVVEGNVTFPNCADDLAVQPDGGVAILSPRQCFVHPITVAPDEPAPDEWPAPDDERDEWEDWPEADPASVIDLETRTFVGNLPGFGPVAIAPDGTTAVAFSRQQTLMRQWNVFQRAAVGLVVIRLADLYWQVVEYGGDEPDFFFAPKGGRVFLHDREGGEDRVVALDAATLALSPLDGPPTRLDRRAVTPDGQRIYALHDGRLRQIRVGTDAVTDVPLDFEAAQVHARPQGDWIVVAEPGVAAIHVLEADDAAPVRVIRP